MRAAEGFVLGGVPAVAMAYLSEEIDPKGLGLAMGLYVGGNAFGGMSGRVVTGMVAEAAGWRVALAVIGVAGLLSAAGFVVLLPPSRNFVRRRGLDARYHAQAWLNHLRDPGLPLLFATGFLVMGGFVTVYNYAGFRLTARPTTSTKGRWGSSSPPTCSASCHRPRPAGSWTAWAAARSSSRAWSSPGPARR